jgi:hypothetical protein
VVGSSEYIGGGTWKEEWVPLSSSEFVFDVKESCSTMKSASEERVPCRTSSVSERRAVMRFSFETGPLLPNTVPADTARPEVGGRLPGSTGNSANGSSLDAVVAFITCDRSKMSKASKLPDWGEYFLCGCIRRKSQRTKWSRFGNFPVSTHFADNTQGKWGVGWGEGGYRNDWLGRNGRGDREREREGKPRKVV